MKEAQAIVNRLEERLEERTRPMITRRGAYVLSGGGTTYNAMTGPDYVTELRRMLREWNWPEWSIETALPRIVKVLLGVGILERVPWGFEPTMRAESEEIWAVAWDLLKREGVGEDIGPAS